MRKKGEKKAHYEKYSCLSDERKEKKKKKKNIRNKQLRVSRVHFHLAACFSRHFLLLCYFSILRERKDVTSFFTSSFVFVVAFVRCRVSYVVKVMRNFRGLIVCFIYLWFFFFLSVWVVQGCNKMINFLPFPAAREISNHKAHYADDCLKQSCIFKAAVDKFLAFEKMRHLNDIC